MNNLVFSTRNMEDFVSDVATEVVKRINLRGDMKPSKVVETPIQLKDVSILARKSKPTIYGYVQRREIPFHKKGNR